MLGSVEITGIVDHYDAQILKVTINGTTSATGCFLKNVQQYYNPPPPFPLIMEHHINTVEFSRFFKAISNMLQDQSP
jgi:hypothetical protein